MNPTDKKLKQFGERACRVSTSEMNDVFFFLKGKVGSYFELFDLIKALPAKQDHGDIDILVLSRDGFSIHEMLKKEFGSNLLGFSKNGNINSSLLLINGVGVHVDFITSSTVQEHMTNSMYLAYNDFSGILGVLSRKLMFNYGTTGFYKIYEDKKGQYHYILLTPWLPHGLRMLGYDEIANKFDSMSTTQDVVDFISFTDLFDSSYFTNDADHNRGDRKRMRSGRVSANKIRDGLVAKQKKRTCEDDDFYLKSLYPDVYANLEKEKKKIEDFVYPKSKYTGEWIFKNFELSPGPVIGDIKRHWMLLYGDKLESTEESELIASTYEFLKSSGYLYT